jgi:hypothetical protein
VGLRARNQVSPFGLRSELLHPALIGIAAHRFIDRLRDDPLDAWDIGFRHVFPPRCLGANVSRTSPVAEPGLAAVGKRTHLPIMMLDLTDEETDALATLLRRTIDDDRYPLSPRIQILKGVLAKLRPEPVREPLRHGRCMRRREPL